MTEDGDADKYQTHVQFAGLVQAATAAAGQDQWTGEGVANGTSAHIEDPAQDSNGFNVTEAAARPSKRRRTDNNEVQQGQYVPPQKSFHEALNANAHETRNDTSGTLEDVATALFRAPSEKSRKYTRPPMSTMFSALQLSPENFLRLQSAAKDYMLDEEFPERRECVGQRGAGENADMVKLRLWNCVRDFLENLGHGEQHWGVEADHASSRTLLWPKDSQQIIKNCVPLLRRMVTNERQRKYATAARKGEKDHLTPKGSSPIPEPGRRSPDLPEAERSLNITSVDNVLDDAFVPTEAEAETWYHDSEQSELVQLSQDLTLTDSDFHQLVAHIDGHLEIFHRGRAACGTSCEDSVLSQLWIWAGPRLVPPTQEPFEISDRSGTLRNLFQSRKMASLRRQDADKTLTPNPSQTIQNSAQTSAQTKTTQTYIGDDKADAEATTLHEDSRTELTILVNILTRDAAPNASSKRVVPRFSLSPDSTSNLAALTEEVHRRVAAAAANNIGVQPQLRIRVWLPDGLVQVSDDGEWMVALLSAGMVDWMDGEVRVLVEV